MPRPHPSAGGDTAQRERNRIQGISQREEQVFDLRQRWNSEIQIWESGLLVQRILRGYSKKKLEKGCRVYPEQAQRR